MTTNPTQHIDQNNPTVFEDFRALLSPNLDNPAAYWSQLTSLLSLYVGMIRHQHRNCSGCRTCQYLADLADLARAHNSLQTYDECLETDQPYPLLSTITTERVPCTMPTSGINA